MAGGINKVILVGNLGQDPEIRYTADGRPIANFSIATSESWKDKNSGEKREKTEWHRVVVFGKLAEICGEYLSKGRQVYIEGKLQTRSWDDEKSGQKRYMTEVNAQRVIFLGGGRGDGAGGSGGGGHSGGGQGGGRGGSVGGGDHGPPDEGPAFNNSDDDIPF